MLRTRQQKPWLQPNDSRPSTMAALAERTARCSRLSPSAPAVAALMALTTSVALPCGHAGTAAASGSRNAASAGAPCKQQYCRFRNRILGSRHAYATASCSRSAAGAELPGMPLLANNGHGQIECVASR